MPYPHITGVVHLNFFSAVVPQYCQTSMEFFTKKKSNLLGTYCTAYCLYGANHLDIIHTHVPYERIFGILRIDTTKQQQQSIECCTGVCGTLLMRRAQYRTILFFGRFAEMDVDFSFAIYTSELE